MLKIAYAPIYKYELPEGHRFPMIKYELIPEQLLYEGTVTNDNFFSPSLAPQSQILLTHTLDYWQKLHNLPLARKEERAIGFPVRDALITRGRYISQGTLECFEYATQYGVAMNIAGGTHHAYANHGEGFCIFNDIAYASNVLLYKGLVHKILVVDLDVHQGNGTAKIFEKNENVFTFSMHGAKNYPTRKEKSDLDMPLPDRTEDYAYLKQLKNALPKLLETLEPDVVFYLSGVDVLETDKLGRLSLSLQGCKERDEFVLKSCKANNIPVVVSMGGGYSERIAHIVEAHSNTFRLAQYLYF